MTADPPPPWARRTFAALAVRPYRRFFAGNVATLLGFWIRIIAQGWLVYEMTGRKDVLGATTAAGLLPLVVLSPWGGVLADRVDRRKLLLAGQSVAALANAGLGVLILARVVTIGHVIGTAVVIGTTRAIEIPVRNAYVRDLVGLDTLPNAIALNAAGFNAARVLGPGIGGVLLGLVGAGPSFLLVGAFNLAMIGALLGLPGGTAHRAAAPASPARQLLEAMAYVRGHARTRTLLVLLSISLVFTWCYQALMPAFARDVLGLGTGGFGFLMACAGAGALLGALWVAGRTGTLPGRRDVVFGLVLGGAAAVAALACARHLVAAVPALLVAGFCQVAFMATANGMVQTSVPDALRGRVMGLWTFVFGASFPLGSLLMGSVSQAWGIPAVWLGGPAITVVLATAVRLRMPPRRPGYDLPGPPPAEAAAPPLSDPVG